MFLEFNQIMYKDIMSINIITSFFNNFVCFISCYVLEIFES